MEYVHTSPAKRRKISHTNQEVLVTQNDEFIDDHSHSRKKLLVLDVNGLLVDIVADPDEAHKPDTVIAAKSVFKRPFCDDFLKFCFERFSVGVWTSRTRRNIKQVLDFLMGDTQHQLLFCWDQSHCTETGFNTIENTSKPLLLKELKKLWEKHRGVYDESNTVLLDDSPYKALRNPPYTTIFPYSYSYRNVQDNGLGPNGDLRNYLERLAASDDVQKFIEQNPFGQQPITHDNESWNFYHKIICSTQPGAGPTRSRKKLIVLDIGGLLVDVRTVPHEGFRPDAVLGSKPVFKRPYCDELLRFCFRRFNVGVWTSVIRSHTERALDFLMRDTQHKLLFCWDLSHCTDTGFHTVENSEKILLLKELRKLWEKEDTSLPWEIGEYDESNTLLVDVNSHRALLNPPHTAIFPYPYCHWHTDDNSLRELRIYLERLAASENVQKFVSENSFGQRPIREKNISWGFYQKVIRAFSCKRKAGDSVDVQCKNPSESKPDTAIASVTTTLLEPKPNSTATTSVAPTLLEPETGTTVLTAPTLLEPETTNTTILTAPTILEPEIDTTAPALLEPETFISDDAQSGFTTSSKGALTADVDNVTVVIALSAKNKSSSSKSIGSNSAVNSSVKGTVKSVEDNSCVKKFQDSPGGKGNTKVTMSVMGTSGSDDIHQDSPPVQTSEAEDGKSNQKRKRGRPPKFVGLKNTHVADDCKSHQTRKRGRPSKSVVKKPIGLLEDDQPLSVCYQQLLSLSLLKKRSLNKAIVNTAGTTNYYQRDWPFMKQCPMWDPLESLMLGLTPPQKPHFSPLKKTEEVCREGLAIAHIVTYWKLVQMVQDLKPDDDSVDRINKSLEVLVDLETHGFDVDSVRSRLNELLYLKSKTSQTETMQKVKDEEEIMRLQ